MKRKLFGAAVAVGLALIVFTPARAEMTELEVMFVKADKNGDYVLSKAEVLMVTLEQFEMSDSDRDNKLEKQEAGDQAKDKEFSDNDTNKDGALSIEEVIEEKLADFKAADTNNDGALDLDEVKAFYEKRS